MAKKSKKKREVLDDKQLVQKAQAQFANGAWAKAVPLYAQLLARNPLPLYQEQYKECQFHIFSALVKESKLTAAQIVLDKTQSTLPKFDFSHWKLNVLVLQADWVGVLKIALNSEEDWWNMKNQTAMIYADSVVLAESLPEALPEPLALHREAFTSALQYVPQQKGDLALSKVQTLDVAPAFKSWHMLIKGLVAFYGDQRSRGLMVFERIPDGGQAKKYVQRFLGQNIGVEESEGNPLASHPEYGPWLETIEHVEKLINARQFDRAYLVCSRKFSDFPNFENRLSGYLTGLFMTIDFKEEDAISEFLDFLSYKSEDGKLNACGEFIYRRTDHRDDQLMIEHHYLEAEDLVESAKKLMHAHEKVKILPDVERVKVILQSRLCQLLSTVGSMPSDRGQGRQKADSSKLVRREFDRLLKMPAIKANELRQCHQYYKDIGEKSKANHLADEMIARFPDNKEALLLNGLECLERNVFVKAITQLKKAYEIDAVDPLVKKRLFFAHQRLISKYYQEGKAKKAEKYMGWVLAESDEQKEDWGTYRAYNFLRFSCLEKIYGNEEASKHYLHKASQILSPVEIEIFSTLAERLYRGREKGGAHYFPELDQRWKSECRAEDVLFLLRALNYFSTSILDFTFNQLAKTMALVPKKVSKWSLADSKMVLNELFDLYRGENPQDLGFSLIFLRDGCRELVKKCSATIKKKEKDDPMASYMALMESRKDIPLKGKRANLMKIIEGAKSEKELKLVKVVEERLEELDRSEEWNPHGQDFSRHGLPPGFPFGGGSGFPFGGRSDFPFDDEDSDCYLEDDLDFPFGDMPPRGFAGGAPSFADVLDKLANEMGPSSGDPREALGELIRRTFGKGGEAKDDKTNHGKNQKKSSSAKKKNDEAPIGAWWEKKL